MIDYERMKTEIAKWQKNVVTLKQSKRKVKPHNKGEFERLLDGLVVKLSLLEEHLYKLKSEGNIVSPRTEKVINKTLQEMDNLSAQATRTLDT